MHEGCIVWTFDTTPGDGVQSLKFTALASFVSTRMYLNRSLYLTNVCIVMNDFFLITVHCLSSI